MGACCRRALQGSCDIRRMHTDTRRMTEEMAEGPPGLAVPQTPELMGSSRFAPRPPITGRLARSWGAVARWRLLPSRDHVPRQSMQKKAAPRDLAVTWELK